MFRHILVPIDGSEAAASAIRTGSDLAKLSGATLTLLYCSQPFDSFAGDPLQMLQRGQYEDAAEAAARDYLERGAVIARERGIEATTVHTFAEQAWQGILDISAKNGCDLVMMGSHGRGGLAGLLLGSQTKRVLAHTRLPVMVCR